MKFKCIKTDQDFLNGNPHLNDRRLSVFDIVSGCKYFGVKNYQKDYNISDHEICEVVKFCMSRSCKAENSFCGGCSLRALQDGIDSKQKYIDRFSEIRFLESDEVVYGKGSGVMVISGGLDSLEEYWKGQDGWKLAESIFNEINYKP